MSSLNRNDSCPCGSGRRYKHCCGALTGSARDDRVRALMVEALALQQRDALGEAERLYVDVLALDPGAVDALHMLGAICFRTGRLRKSQQLIREALDRTEWQIPMIRHNYALLLTALARADLAVEALRGGDEAFRGWIDAEGRRFAEAIGVTYAGLPPWPAGGANPGGSGLRVLIVDEALPTPDRNSGSGRMVAIMRILQSLGCTVAFATREVAFAGSESEALRALGVEVLCKPDVWSVDQILAVRGRQIDLVWMTRHHVAAEFVAPIRRCAPHALFVLDTVDLHHVREGREADVKGDPELRRRADATRDSELAMIRAADVTLVVSEREREVVLEEIPGADVRVISHIDSLRPVGPGFGMRRDMFFIGGFGHPGNVDAVLWYAEAIWPHVLRRLPDARTLIIGADMPPAVLGLAGDGIEVVGYVPDLDPYLQRCRLSIAPLRFGAGVKGKITTAQTAGVPVVATSIAAEGMHLEHERDVLIADSAEAFAAAIVRLHGDEALWNRLAEAGRETAARYFSPEAARGVLSELVAAATAKRRTSTA